MATKKTEALKVEFGVGVANTTKNKQSTGTSILSDYSTVPLYKKQIDALSKQISQWDKALTEAETYLNSTIGSTFKANYAVGAKAATNIQKVIDILQACKSDLKKLTAAGTELYKKIQTASKK